MNTISDFKAAFADLQAEQAKLFSQLCVEITVLNKKNKELTAENEELKKPAEKKAK